MTNVIPKPSDKCLVHRLRHQIKSLDLMKSHVSILDRNVGLKPETLKEINEKIDAKILSCQNRIQENGG